MHFFLSTHFSCYRYFILGRKNILGWSNGKTVVSFTTDWGSIPCSRAMKKKKSKGGLFTYTTSIEPSSTIAEIQENLVRHGAKSVLANYTNDGKIEALSFQIATPEGSLMAIRLPCDAKPVYEVLKQQYHDGKISRSYVDEHQALRVAWRIVKYWVEAQMALLETQMVKMEQIFLPYAIVRNGKTLFESMKENKFTLLDAKIESGAISGEVIET